VTSPISGWVTDYQNKRSSVAPTGTSPGGLNSWVDDYRRKQTLPYDGRYDTSDDDAEQEVSGIVGWGKYIWDVLRQRTATPIGSGLSAGLDINLDATKGELGVSRKKPDNSFAGDVANTVRNAGNYLADATVQSLAEDVAKAVGAVGSMPIEIARSIASEPGNALGGLAYAMIGQPLEAITGMRNAGGKAVPMTPEEQYQTTKDVAGLAVDITLSRGLFRGMINPSMHSTRLGALADVSKANFASGIVGGLAGGTVAGMGEEDMLSQMALATIISGPASVVFGTAFDLPAYMREVKDIRINARQAAVAQMGVLNGLAIDLDTPLAQVFANIDALKSTDGFAEALVKARLIEGVPAVIPNVSKSTFDLLAANFDVSVAGGAQFRTSYKISDEFGAVPTTRAQRQIAWNNDFDKVAYRASKKGTLSDADQALVDDLIKQSNGSVTFADLKNHGKMLRDRINNVQKQGKAVPPDQVEIDTRWRGIVEKGQNIIKGAVEGQQIKDATNATWIKSGDQFVNEATGAVYPSASEELAKILGARGSLDPTAPKIDYGVVDYDPVYGTPIKGPYFKYYNPENQTALITQNKLSPQSEALFTKTGYTIGEQVVTGGERYIVTGLGGQPAGQAPRLMLTGVSNGKKISAAVNRVARNMNKPSVEFLSSTPVFTLHKAVPTSAVDAGLPTGTNGATVYRTSAKYVKGASASNNVTFKNLFDFFDASRNPDGTPVANIAEMLNNKAKELGSNYNYEATIARYAKDTPAVQQQKAVIDFARENGFDGVRLGATTFAQLPDVAKALPDIMSIDSPAAKKLLDGLYKRFLAEQMTGKSNLNFNDKFNAFFADTKMPLEQRQTIQSAMLQRLRQDADAFAAKFDPDNNILKGILDDATAYDKSVDGNLRGNLEDALSAHGMYIDSDGSGGAFQIYFRDGTKFTEVSNINEGLEALHKQGFGSAVDVDGGGTQSIATELAGVSKLRPVVKYSEPNIFGRKLIDMRAGKGALGSINSFFTNLPARMAAIDEWIQVNVGNGDVKLFRAYDLLAQAHDKMKNYVASDKFQPIVKQYTEMMRAVHALDANLQPEVARAAEFLSIKEITDSPALLGRQASPVDVQFAQQMAGMRGYQTTAAILERAAIDKISLGEAAELVKADFKKRNIAYVQEAELIAQQMKATPDDQLSWLHAFEIAKRLENKSLDKTRAQFLQESGLSSNRQFMLALDAQTRMYEMAAKELDLPASKYIASYFPHFRQLGVYNKWGQTGLPAEFLNDIKRTGIMDPTAIRMDPVDVAHDYLMAMARRKTGFTESAKQIDAEIRSQILGTPERPSSIPVDDQSWLTELWDETMSKARGVPDVSSKIANATFKTLSKSLGAHVGNSIIFDAVNLSLQGGLPILGVRDFGTAMIMGQTLLGSEAMAHGLRNIYGAASEARIADYYRRGVAPTVDPGNLVNPSSGVNLGLRTASQEMVDLGLKASLQPQSYNRTLMVMFSASEYKMQQAMRKVGNTDMESLLRELALDAEPLPIQQWFVEKMQAGKPLEAQDIYARWMTRKVANFYGAMYNPIGWRAIGGRLLGQYGSWTVNATQTFTDMFARGGTDMTKVMRASKFATLTAALGYAGAEAGLNLTNWQWNPLSYPTGSPVLGFMTDAQRVLNEDGDVESKMKKALNTIIPVTGPETGNYTRTFTPFSRMMSAWAQSYDALNSGNSEFQVLMRFLGQPLAK
jgi:hypothetical protein